MRIVVVFRRNAALFALVLAVPLAGCSGNDSGRPEVVTSIYPLQYLAERIVDDRVEVTNLTQPGQESHDFELGIEQTAMLSEAEVVVYLAGFQPAVDDAVEQQQPGHLLDASDHVELRSEDPHFWLDPALMSDLATAVGSSMSEAYPDHADEFAANLDALTADLAELDEDYRIGLADCERTDVVVGHDAFGYLAKYGLELHPIAGLSPGAEPSPARLAELSDVIEETGVTTVFSEVLASPAMAETLSDELGLRTAVLDPVEGLADASSDDDYVSLMEENLAALRKANGCR